MEGLLLTTDSILIKKSDIVDVSLDPDHEFSQKEHQSFKADLLEFNQGKVKLWEYKCCDDRRHSNKSVLKTVAWVKACLRCARTNSAQIIPSWLPGTLKHY